MYGAILLNVASWVEFVSSLINRWSDYQIYEHHNFLEPKGNDMNIEKRLVMSWLISLTNTDIVN